MEASARLKSVTNRPSVAYSHDSKFGNGGWVCAQAQPKGQSRVMQTTLETKVAAQAAGDALILVVFEGEKEERFGAAELWESGEIAGKPHELTLVHNAPGAAAKRVLFAGAGKRDKCKAADSRNLVAEAVRFLKPKSVKTVAVALEGSIDGPEFIAAAVEGAILGDYEPDIHKGGEKKALDSVAI